MGENGNTVKFASSELNTMDLKSHTELWKKDRASADLVALEWAALQGKYYQSGDSTKYVTRGSIIVCDKGSLFSRIDLPVDHGVETRNTRLPLLTVADFRKENIPDFGVCSLNKTAPYLCRPVVSNQWVQNAATTTAANKAAILQADAFAVCNVGGLVSVKEVNKTPQESLMAVFQEQYGFDERTTKIILDVHQAIQDKYQSQKQVERDWRFTRLLGGMQYGLTEKDGWKHEFLWNGTAGDPTYALRDKRQYYRDRDGREQFIIVKSEMDLDMKTYMTGELGISGGDYEYLQYKVRIQHQLANGEASTLRYKDGGEPEPSDLADMDKAYGRNLGTDEFIEYWNQQCDDMCGMADFAHQQITTATILVTVSKGVANRKVEGVAADGYFMLSDPDREAMAGWLGDAVIFTTDVAKNERIPPSFKNDDYMADLDAENIGHMVRDEGYTYLEAVQDYYGRRLLGENRASIFLEKMPLYSVKYRVYLWLIPDYDVLMYENDAMWLKRVKEMAPDAYNFIRSLEESLPEMEVFE